MRAAVGLVLLGGVAGWLLSGCGGSSLAGRRTPATYQNMRTLASTFQRREYPELHGSAAPGGPYESRPAQVTCKKTGALDAACVLTFWPIRYDASGIEYRYVKQGPARFKVTVTIAPDGKSVQPSIPQKEGLAE
jgi:hypothetical protein